MNAVKKRKNYANSNVRYGGGWLSRIYMFYELHRNDDQINIKPVSSSSPPRGDNECIVSVSDDYVGDDDDPSDQCDKVTNEGTQTFIICQHPPGWSQESQDTPLTFQNYIRILGVCKMFSATNTSSPCQCRFSLNP